VRQQDSPEAIIPLPIGSAPVVINPTSNGHAGKTVRQITLEELDNMIHHLQQTRALMAALPVVE